LRVKEWHPDFAPLHDLSHVQPFLEITRRWVLCFCDLESFGAYRAAAGGQRTSKSTKLPDGTRVPANKAGGYIRSWVWRKKQAAPQLSGDRPANSCEGIAVMHPPGVLSWNGRGTHAWTDLDRENQFPAALDNCCIFGRDREAEKAHACQKPAAISEHLIEKFTSLGDVIADWYCGSGAIPAASIKLGRRAIACDSDRKWAEHTAERLRGMLL
jgi:site-specific DNA-methyltransferase (adenine-specific)